MITTEINFQYCNHERSANIPIFKRVMFRLREKEISSFTPAFSLLKFLRIGRTSSLVSMVLSLSLAFNPRLRLCPLCLFVSALILNFLAFDHLSGLIYLFFKLQFYVLLLILCSQYILRIKLRSGFILRFA